MYHRVRIQSFYILPTENTYVFLKSLRLLNKSIINRLLSDEDNVFSLMKESHKTLHMDT